MARLYKMVIDEQKRFITLYYGSEKQPHTVLLLSGYLPFKIIMKNCPENKFEFTKEELNFLPEWVHDFKEHTYTLHGKYHRKTQSEA